MPYSKRLTIDFKHFLGRVISKNGDERDLVAPNSTCQTTVRLKHNSTCQTQRTPANSKGSGPRFKPKAWFLSISAQHLVWEGHQGRLGSRPQVKNQQFP